MTPLACSSVSIVKFEQVNAGLYNNNQSDAGSGDKKLSVQLYETHRFSDLYLVKARRFLSTRVKFSSRKSQMFYSFMARALNSQRMTCSLFQLVTCSHNL